VLIIDFKYSYNLKSENFRDKIICHPDMYGSD